MVSTAMNGTGWSKTTFPVPSVTLKTGAYPWPMMKTRTPSTVTGWLTRRLSWRTAPPGCAE